MIIPQGFLLFSSLVSDWTPPWGDHHCQTKSYVWPMVIDHWYVLHRWSTLSQIFGMRWNFVKISSVSSVSTYFASLPIVQIEESLEQFYLHCLLPELADPRFGCRGKDNGNIRNLDLKNAKRIQILRIENLNLKLRAPRGLPVREPHYIVEVSWSPGQWPSN